MTPTLRRWLHRILSLFVLWGAPSLTSPSSALGLLGLAVAELAALVWLFWAVVWLAPPGGWLFARRRQWTMAFAILAGGWLLLATGLALVPAGPTQAMRRAVAAQSGSMSPSAQDLELGWAPISPPDVVGSRLQRVDPKRPRVLLIGDSIIYGPDLADAQVATGFAEQALPGWQVLNGAVSGWSIEQYFLYLDRVIDASKPRAIVVGLFMGNDLQLTGREFSPWGHSKPLWALRGGRLASVAQHRQCLDTLSQSVLFRPLWRDQHRTARAVATICDAQHLGRGELEVAVGAMFRHMEDAAVRAGAQIYWVLLPSVQEFDPGREADTRYVRQWRTFHRILRAGGHKVWDFFPVLARRPEGVQGLYLEDNSHFTPAGHAVLGQWLGEQLRAALPADATATGR